MRRSTNLVLLLLTFALTNALDDECHRNRDRKMTRPRQLLPSFVDLKTTPALRVVDGHSCARMCLRGVPPLVCTFKFRLEYYHVMGPACRDCPKNQTACFENQCVTADGVERGIIAVNRQLPGPSIQVCQGDMIVVDVENRVHGGTVSIHWHGILQHDAQFMDGVPMLTQCPILPGTTFRYAYQAADAGTFFWHSHDGFQKMDGVTGALVVRSPVDPSRRHYDFDLPDHVILLNDWIHQFMAERIPGPRTPTRRGQHPDALLINGRGASMGGGHFEQMPVSEFQVRRGRKYRFRLVHAGCLVCPLRFSIEGHKLQVLATDSYPVQPRVVDSIVIFSGERYDFVVETNNRPLHYWMTVVALGDCESSKIIQNAILSYDTATQFASSARFPVEYPPPGLVMNPMNAACSENENGVCVTQLKPEAPAPLLDPVLTTTDVTKLTITFDFHQFTYDELFNSGKDYKFYVPFAENEVLTIAGRMNNISMVMPPAPPLSQPEVLEEICNSGSEFCCQNPASEPRIATHRQCLNMLSVPLGAIVEILYLDNMNTNGSVSHPIHMHGLSFYVMDIGTAQDRQAGKHLLPFFPEEFVIRKDTVAVPSNGYVRVRFQATNPGYWLIHCHVLVHSETGMGAILKIGDQSEMPKPPPNFPTCGNYQPKNF